ncbi:MAG: hypothetical protein KBF37_00405 [Saprospiraceae bacterium]|jgi:Spy/CpxP family protein refolding chaperone|nr:hypothetical protein [Saprospiraceae bacterium]MBP9208755.1 hypothetical protein [Saprospiraceae bacterium]MBV6472317.1 hypothetical protein [Saprospiraceae bacterium]
MKTTLNTLIALTTCIAAGLAQDDAPGPPPERERALEKMESMRVAFMTNELDLNSEESARFWPLYNEYSKKRMELRKDLLLSKRENRREKLSEEESERLVEEQLALQQQELELKKNYYDRFRAILPAQKLARLEPSEKAFNQEVLKRLRERRENRMARPGRMRR